MHISPRLRANKTAPSIALSKNASSASMTELKNMLGDFPPNSSVTGIIFSVAYCMTNRPVAVDPVKAAFATLGLVTKARPSSEPNPFTIFMTPAGIRSPIISIKTRIDAGVLSAGFKTTVFPAASAGASFHTAIKIGKFHGIICATTPIGSCTIKETVLLSNSVIDPSSARITPAKYLK
ncbi:hypothetical protein D3C73_1178790 [compost metagenome]